MRPQHPVIMSSLCVLACLTGGSGCQIGAERDFGSAARKQWLTAPLQPATKVVFFYHYHNFCATQHLNNAVKHGVHGVCQIKERLTSPKKVCVTQCKQLKVNYHCHFNFFPHQTKASFCSHMNCFMTTSGTVSSGLIIKERTDKLQPHKPG